MKTTIPTTGKPKIITILPVHVDRLNRTYLPAPSPKRKPPVTILRPVKPEIATPKVYQYQNEVTDKPGNIHYDVRQPNNDNAGQQEPAFGRNRPKYDRQRPNYEGERQKTRYNGGYVSTTQVPLRYHSTVNNMEENSVTTAPEKFSIGKYHNIKYF